MVWYGMVWYGIIDVCDGYLAAEASDRGSCKSTFKDSDSSIYLAIVTHFGSRSK